MMQKHNIGFGQQNQEFSIQNEDFPALPGYKGASIYVSLIFWDMFNSTLLREPFNSRLKVQMLYGVCIYRDS